MNRHSSVFPGLEVFVIGEIKIVEYSSQAEKFTRAANREAVPLSTEPTLVNRIFLHIWRNACIEEEEEEEKEEQDGG